MKRSEERTRQAKHRIFTEIDALLETYDLDGITFGRIAKRLGCQPNSVAYYFNNKTDMLQQFIQDYMVTADTELLPVLRSGIDALPPVERFCREIDCIFSVSDHKSRPRLIANHLLISHAAIHKSFNIDLDRKMRQDWDSNRNLLTAYRKFEILAEDRFDDAYLELTFYESLFSLSHIFSLPVWDCEASLHNTKERLKAAFLKDGLYTPQYRNVDLSNDLPFPDMEESSHRYIVPDDQIPALKLEVFRSINRLLEADRPGDITFAKLAELCYCQPSGIAYYFKDKDDMLLQALVWKLEQIKAAPSDGVPAETPDFGTFCRLIAEILYSNPAYRDRWTFWANYYLLSNLNRSPDFRHYYSFYRKRNYSYLLTRMDRFSQDPCLIGENMRPAFLELATFREGLSSHLLFQVPVMDMDRLLRITQRRLLSHFVRPEYLEEALRRLEQASDA